MKLTHPEFDEYGDPTEDTLLEIEGWQPDFAQPDPWAAFITFCMAAWNVDYGVIRAERDECGKALICFVTGGWSANEMVRSAMERNSMFMAMRWESSSRGGVSKYAAK